jgi:hypothetical protein
MQNSFSEIFYQTFYFNMINLNIISLYTAIQIYLFSSNTSRLFSPDVFSPVDDFSSETVHSVMKSHHKYVTTETWGTTNVSAWVQIS